MIPSFVIDAWSFSTTPPTPLLKTQEMKDFCWFHCQRDADGLYDWLIEQDLSPALVSAALAEDTRPRFHRFDNNTFLLILRGVNLNEGMSTDDMISLRILFCNNRLFTFRKHPLRAVSYIRESLERGDGPESIDELLICIVEQIHKRINDVLDTTEETIEDLQDHIQQPGNENSKQLSELHRRLLRLNRYLKPQTSALSEFCNSKTTITTDNDINLHFQNQRDVIFRLVEHIEALNDQVWMLREHQQQAMAEIMNRNAYRLSVLAGVFLPLGFVTGLLGVNVGGIPGTDSPLAFTLLCTILLGLGVVEFLLLRRLRFW